MHRWAVHTAKPLLRSGLWRLNQILFANTPNTEKDQANRGQCPVLLASVFLQISISRLKMQNKRREIKNLGGNQLHCYPCDYSSCLGCVSLSLSSQGSGSARVMTTLNDNKPSHRKHSHRTKRVRTLIVVKQL